MYKKVGVILGLIILGCVLVFSIFNFGGGVSAASVTCTWRNQTLCGVGETAVLSLSSDTNAHGAKGNGGAEYPWKLCCSGGSIPASCSSGNTLVKLFSDTNAHGAVPTDLDYTTKVCYEGLTCVVRDVFNCQGDETLLMRLSGINNAHIEKSPGIDYGQKICCMMGGDCEDYTTKNTCLDSNNKDLTGTCSGYTTPATCEAHTDCMWESQLGKCFGRAYCTWNEPWYETKQESYISGKYNSGCCNYPQQWDKDLGCYGTDADPCTQQWEPGVQIPGVTVRDGIAGQWTKACDTEITGIPGYGFWYEVEKS